MRIVLNKPQNVFKKTSNNSFPPLPFSPHPQFFLSNSGHTCSFYLPQGTCSANLNPISFKFSTPLSKTILKNTAKDLRPTVTSHMMSRSILLTIPHAQFVPQPAITNLKFTAAINLPVIQRLLMQLMNIPVVCATLFSKAFFFLLQGVRLILQMLTLKHCL